MLTTSAFQALAVNRRMVPRHGDTKQDFIRQRSAGKSDSGPGHQLNDSTTAFHFDSGSIAWIHTDDHALSADPQVQVQTAVVDR